MYRRLAVGSRYGVGGVGGRGGVLIGQRCDRMIQKLSTDIILFTCN